MKFLTMFVMSAVILLMAACSPGGGELTPVPEPIETKPALETAVPLSTSQPTTAAYPDAGYPAAASILETVDPYPGQDDGLAVEPAFDSAYPAAGDETAEESSQPDVPDAAVNIVQQVSQDLAGRLSLDVADITVVSATEIEWPDSALGCPQEGYAYMQVITPGYQVVLTANNQEYEYHTNMTGNFLLCQEGKPVFD